MSRAFVKEDAVGEAPLVPRRALLPEGVPNLVTRSGLAALEAERAGLAAELRRLEAGPQDLPEHLQSLLVVRERLMELDERLASARLAPPPRDPAREVALGSLVTVRRGTTDVQFRIVGVDEADPGEARVAFTAPVAAAVLGRCVGDVVESGESGPSLTILAVRYDDDGSGSGER